jgi:hypothetical protein
MKTSTLIEMLQRRLRDEGDLEVCLSVHTREGHRNYRASSVDTAEDRYQGKHTTISG